MATKTTARRMLTPTEVAERLSVSRPTIYRLLAANIVPAVRVGNQWRVDQDELEVWVARQGVNTEQAA